MLTSEMYRNLLILQLDENLKRGIASVVLLFKFKYKKKIVGTETIEKWKISLYQIDIINTETRGISYIDTNILKKRYNEFEKRTKIPKHFFRSNIPWRQLTDNNSFLSNNMIPSSKHD